MAGRKAEEVLRFWFPEHLHDDHAVMLSQFEWWFRGGADSAIAARFARLLERAARGELDHWAHGPRSRLALIIVLDQFSRSIHRGTARAFVQDGKALDLALEGIEIGHYAALETPVGEDVFLLASGALRAARAPGDSSQAGRGARGTGAFRAPSHAGALGIASPWPSRRHCPVRPPSSPQRCLGAAINAGRAGLPGRRPARPYASAAALSHRCPELHGISRK
jgi:Bacterial protein of unknown function (DUF924)